MLLFLWDIVVLTLDISRQLTLFHLRVLNQFAISVGVGCHTNCCNRWEFKLWNPVIIWISRGTVVAATAPIANDAVDAAAHQESKCNQCKDKHCDSKRKQHHGEDEHGEPDHTAVLPRCTSEHQLKVSILLDSRANLKAIYKEHARVGAAASLDLIVWHDLEHTAIHMTDFERFFAAELILAATTAIWAATWRKRAAWGSHASNIEVNVISRTVWLINMLAVDGDRANILVAARAALLETHLDLHLNAFSILNIPHILSLRAAAERLACGEEVADRICKSITRSVVIVALDFLLSCESVEDLLEGSLID